MSKFNPQPKSITIKKTPKPLKRSPLKKKFNATGEKNVFKSVIDRLSDNEPCECFVCGTPIALVMPHNFAHVLSKGKYPKMRLEPRNIVLLCHKIIASEKGSNGQGCHYAFDFTPHSELKGEGWEKIFNLREELKEEYKKL